MTDYDFELKKDGKTIANGGISTDCALRILIAIMNQKAVEAGDVQYVPPQRPHSQPTAKRGRRPKELPHHKAKTDSEVMQQAAHRHPATQQIEDMLIDGMTTSAIMEQVEVSAPTVGVIRARLKNDGRLT
jgi:hypothetical protein